MTDVPEEAERTMKRAFAPLVWARMIRVTRKIRRVADHAVRPTGCATAHFALLFEIEARPGMTQQELADRLQLTKGNIAQLVEKMGQDGLIARTQEGRMKRLSLTPKGEAMMREHLGHHDQFICQQFAALNEEELRQLQRLLRKLDRSLT